MKNKLFRRAAVLTAALFSLTCMSVTAYAQSDEPAEETTPPVATETVAKPFTPDGTRTARSFSPSPPPARMSFIWSLTVSAPRPMCIS